MIRVTGKITLTPGSKAGHADGYIEVCEGEGSRVVLQFLLDNSPVAQIKLKEGEAEAVQDAIKTLLKMIR